MSGSQRVIGEFGRMHRCYKIVAMCSPHARSQEKLIAAHDIGCEVKMTCIWLIYRTARFPWSVQLADSPCCYSTDRLVISHASLLLSLSRFSDRPEWIFVSSQQAFASNALHDIWIHKTVCTRTHARTHTKIHICFGLTTCRIPFESRAAMWRGGQYFFKLQHHAIAHRALFYVIFSVTSCYPVGVCSFFFVFFSSECWCAVVVDHHIEMSIWFWVVFASHICGSTTQNTAHDTCIYRIYLCLHPFHVFKREKKKKPTRINDAKRQLTYLHMEKRAM